jgi:hypothetical protein
MPTAPLLSTMMCSNALMFSPRVLLGMPQCACWRSALQVILLCDALWHPINQLLASRQIQKSSL